MRGRLRSLLVAAVVLAAVPLRVAWAEPLSPEVQLSLQHLREGERDRLQRVVGDLGGMPLYRVQLDVDPGERRVTGRVQVEVTPRARTLDRVFLRVTPNAQGRQVTLRNATVNGQAAVMEQPEPTLFRVRLDPAVPPGASAVVEVQLEATVPRAPKRSGSLLSGMLGGQGSRDYGAFAATPEVMSLVGILPMIPPEDPAGEPLPGPSGLGDLALFEPSNILASIVAPAGWRVLTTGAALGEVPEKDGRHRFSFAASAVRDLPLVVARGYEKQSKKLGDLEIESWFSQRNAKAGSAALEHASAVLGVLQKRLGPIPWKVFRVVEVPLSGGAGGMEFSGFVTVSSDLYVGSTDPGAALGMPGLEALLGGAPEGGPGLGQMFADVLEFTVAHEIAHQYFPMLVGSDPVREPVVDESLAQYLALLSIEWRHGPRVAERFRSQHLVSGYHFYRLSGGEDGPAARPTSAFDGSAEYAALVYGKAPLLHHQERRLVGDDAFNAALARYLETYRYRWACGACFTRVLAKQSPANAKNLEALRVRWWEEAHGDEDLGTPDLGGMLQGFTGQKLDPHTKQMLEQILRGLSGE